MCARECVAVALLCTGNITRWIRRCIGWCPRFSDNCHCHREPPFLLLCVCISSFHIKNKHQQHLHHHHHHHYDDDIIIMSLQHHYSLLPPVFDSPPLRCASWRASMAARQSDPVMDSRDTYIHTYTHHIRRHTHTRIHVHDASRRRDKTRTASLVVHHIDTHIHAHTHINAP